ncbi:MAG TPA: polysaccharide deacetylase family protein [Syntrophomonadaceae bacterium]|nr:polysaccharide deacetylase family protein [Syntrophomonadaceae bacterium]
MKNPKSLTRIVLYLLCLMLLAAALLPCTTMYKRNYAITILEYHNIAAEMVSCDQTWTVSETDFQEQMAYLNQHCHVIPLRSLLQMMRKGTRVPENTIAITFDDGYRSNYLLAYPVMARYRIPSTIFIVGKNIETGRVGDDPALQWDDMQTMYASGLVDIQSHSYDLHHDLLSGKQRILEPAALALAASDQGMETPAERDRRVELDLVKSRQQIEEKLGNKVDILCWPFGAFDRNDTELAHKAGYVFAMGNVRYSNPKTSMSDIGRVVVPAGMNITDFRELVHPHKITYFQAVQMDWIRIKYHVNHLFKK